MNYIKEQKEFFKGIGKILYEGTESDNPFAFRWYNPDYIIRAKAWRSISSLLVLTGILSMLMGVILLEAVLIYSHGIENRMLLNAQR